MLQWWHGARAGGLASLGMALALLGPCLSAQVPRPSTRLPARPAAAGLGPERDDLASRQVTLGLALGVSGRLLHGVLCAVPLVVLLSGGYAATVEAQGVPHAVTALGNLATVPGRKGGVGKRA
jgi:hypothetical protein